jgi:hypothetical protein
MRSQNNPAFSVPAILAGICGIGSLWVGGAFFGIILAVAAIIFGVLGAALAVSPRVRGGIVSFLSIGLGLVGIIAAIVRFFTLNWF